MFSFLNYLFVLSIYFWKYIYIYIILYIWYICNYFCIRLKITEMFVYRCIHTHKSIYLSFSFVDLSFYLSLSLCLFLSLSLFLSRSLGRWVCRSVGRSVCLSVSSVCLSVYLFIYLSICLQDCRKQDFISRNSIQSRRHLSSVYTCIWRIII